MVIVGGVLLVSSSICARLYYALARWLFLRDTGRKLTHVDRQLIASEGVHEDLPAAALVRPRVMTHVGRPRSARSPTAATVTRPTRGTRSRSIRAMSSRTAWTCLAGSSASASTSHDHDYQLRGSEVRTLATIGAFRVVPADDLRDDRGPGRRRAAWRPRAAADGGPDPHRGAPRSRRSDTPIVTLDRPRPRAAREPSDARARAVADLLCGRRSRAASCRTTPSCIAPICGAAERLRADGARIHRVVLDYELKRDYQRFLQERNRDRSDSDGRPDRDARGDPGLGARARPADGRRPRAVP